MSMNKAINQVIMHEQIGGNKQAPPQPIKPVKMPDPRKPEGSTPKRPIGGNLPPSPPPTDGGAEVTPPEGLPESMKAFWKQRLVNQLIERKQLGVLKQVGKAVGGGILPGPDDLIVKGIEVYDRHVDAEHWRQTHDYNNPESPYYDPNRDPWENFPLPMRPNVDTQGNSYPGGLGGGWAGGNAPNGGGSVVA